MKAKLNFDRFPGAAIPASFILAALLFSAAPAEAQTATFANTAGQPTVLLASDAGDNLGATPPTTAGGLDDSSFTISIRNYNIPGNALWVNIRVSLAHEDLTIEEGVVTNSALIPGLATTGAKRMQSTDYDFTFGDAPAESVFLRFDNTAFRMLVPAAAIRDDNGEDITINISARAEARLGATTISNDVFNISLLSQDPAGGFVAGLIEGNAIPAENITGEAEFTVTDNPVDTQTPTATFARTPGQPSVLLASDAGDDLEATPPTTAGGLDDSSFTISIRNYSVPGNALWVHFRILVTHEDPTIEEGVVFNRALIPGLESTGAKRMQSIDYDFTFGDAPAESVFLINDSPGLFRVLFPATAIRDDNEEDITINISARAGARPGATTISNGNVRVTVRTQNPAGGIALGILGVSQENTIEEENITGEAVFTVTTASTAGAASLILAEQDGEVSEGEEVTGFTLTLSSAPREFNHAVITYTLAGAATLGEDYDAVFILGVTSTEALTTGTTGTLSISNTAFTAGTTAISIEIDAIDDGVAEPEGEEILLTISEVEYFSDTTGSNSLGTAKLISSSATLTITDIVIGAASLILTEQDGEVNEGEEVTGFTLTLTSALQEFNHAIITYTLGGAATPGEDYNAVFILGTASTQALTTGTTGTLSISNTAFTASAAAIPIEIDAIADEAAEPEGEDIRLTINSVEYFSDTAGSNSLGTAVLISSSATLSIIDAAGLRIRVRVFLEGPLR